MRAAGWCGAIISILTATLGAREALAEKRVALVIGNSAYQKVPKLANPVNDAAAIHLLLKSANFDVVELRQNLPVNELRRAVRDFSDRVRDADMAVVFYAGHGIEVNGSNYLIPTDATLEKDIDVEDESISLERILSVIEPARRLRLVILDACRDNPFLRSMKRTIGSRSIGRGLAGIEPSRSDTLIAYAAKGGSTAADGQSQNSPFTSALLKYLAVPGLDLRIAFGQVRDEVLRTTNNRQEPFVYGSLGGGVVSLAPPVASDMPAATPAPAARPQVDPNEAVARDYEIASKLRTQEAWDAFLARHPSGMYADVARAERGKLTALTPAPRPEPPPRAEPEQRAKTVPEPASHDPPTFDCRTHFGADEIAICGSGKLSSLDRQLGAVYAALRPRLNSASQARLREEQRSWLRQRAGCGGSESCLTAAYESRLSQLRSWR